MSDAAKASHSHKTWAEVFSFAHTSIIKTAISPISWRCLLRVLCPVTRPLTKLVCFLVKESSLVLAVGVRSAISF